MTEFFLAPVLVKFKASIDAAYPNRDKSSDGWIGDASHAARVSEHNPCWACRGYLYGIVRAIDVDIDDNDAKRDLRREIISSAVGHPAVWYVISNGIIWSRTYGWQPHAYDGPNKHLKHVHISCWTSVAAAKDQTLILKRPATPKPPPAGDDMPLNATDLKAIKATVTEVVRDFALWEALYGLETEDERAAAREAYTTARAAGKTVEEARAEAAKQLQSLITYLKDAKGK